MSKPVILVTGKQGQLGWELTQLAGAYPQYDFVFADRTTMDLSDDDSLRKCFEQYKPDYCINCAAYTAVDKAETEQAMAYQVNAAATGLLATLCNQYNTVLMTISTDYVFNGNGTSPYTTEQATDPVNYYGYTKAIGEQLALANHPATIIIRTSWVYSSHGNNFVKTMLRLMKERDALNVVADQVGSPTYAHDLAKAILLIIEEQEKGNKQYGIFHYSNSGVTNWCDFAREIGQQASLSCVVNGITTAEYPTAAKRPAYSVMDINKITAAYGIVMRHWKEALHECILKLQL
ncbi:MAG: dTDP-4-dehydrorhamnose reductase [Bacteroidota bacterium]